MPFNRLARCMASTTLCLIVLMLAANLAVWLFPRLSSIEGGLGLSFSLSDRMVSALGPNVTSMPWWQTLGAIMLSSLPLLVLSFGLLNLRALFKSYAAGEYFSATTSTHMRRLGIAVALWVVLGVLCEPLLSAWATMQLPPGQRFISLSFDSSGIVALFLAGCVIVVASILRRAHEIDSENKHFV